MINRAYILAFALILALPILGLFTEIDFKWVRSAEKRTLTQWPADKTPLGQWPEEFDAYYNDHFEFRNTLTRAYSLVKYRGFGVSPFPQKVTVGKDGWLFNLGPRHIKHVLGGREINSGQIVTIKQNIKQQKSWLDSLGIRLYIAVVPSKANVYGNYLPDYLYQDTLPSLFGKITGALENEVDIELINLGKGFDQNVLGTDLYHKTDLHWTDFGAFLGAQYLLQRIKEDYPDLEIVNLNEFREKSFSKWFDLAKLINVPIQEELTILEPKKPLAYQKGEKKWAIPQNYTRNPELYEDRYICPNLGYELKTLVFHDSFMQKMKKSVCQSFTEIIFHRRNLKDDYWWDKKLVLKEKPDIIIVEISESLLLPFLLIANTI